MEVRNLWARHFLETLETNDLQPSQELCLGHQSRRLRQRLFQSSHQLVFILESEKHPPGRSQEYVPPGARLDEVARVPLGIALQ